jgi:hypothetical protein
VDIEIALRLCCASLSRKPHKQISLSEDVVRIPIQIIFVYIEIRDILLCIPLEATIHNVVEVAIQSPSAMMEAFCLIFSS